MNFKTIVLLAGTLSPLAAAQAQREAWLDVLTPPPPTAGTCMPPTQSSIQSVPPMMRHRLIMVSAVPGGARREMVVVLDASGHPRQYSDIVFKEAGAGVSNGETVFASIDLTGRANGRRMHSSTKMGEAPPTPSDTAAMRRWMNAKRNAVTESSTEPLDAAGQTKAVELAKWLAGRCKDQVPDSNSRRRPA